MTSYAERNPGDEEAVECFTTFVLSNALPKNNSLVAEEIRFFNALPSFPALRAPVQRLRD